LLPTFENKKKTEHQVKIIKSNLFIISVELILEQGGAGIAQSVKRLATGWTVRESNLGGREIIRTCPDRL
jgi:hypothetical protein